MFLPALEMQSLTTSTYHVCRDGMQLQKQRTKRDNSRELLEKEILGAFKSSTKYSLILLAPRKRTPTGFSGTSVMNCFITPFRSTT